MALPTKLCCYDTSLLTVKPVINFIRKVLQIMDNLDELDRQRGENRERQRRRREHRSQEERDIENEHRILIFY
jgi:hypothetical protein